MSKIFKLALISGLALTASACGGASGGNGAVGGVLYSGYKMGGAVTNGTGTKTGQACASSILGLIGTGDASHLQHSRSVRHELHDRDRQVRRNGGARAAFT
jgi:hypothetical protein